MTKTGLPSAGRFIADPVRIAVLKYGRVLFLSASGESCWRDADGREVVQTVCEAETILRAHGYALDVETKTVSRYDGYERQPGGSSCKTTTIPTPTSTPEPTPVPTREKRKRPTAGEVDEKIRDLLRGLSQD